MILLMILLLLLLLQLLLLVVVVVVVVVTSKQITKLESTGCSTLPSPRRLMQHCGVQSQLGRHTHREAEHHNTFSARLAKQGRY